MGKGPVDGGPAGCFLHNSILSTSLAANCSKEELSEHIALHVVRDTPQKFGITDQVAAPFSTGLL